MSGVICLQGGREVTADCREMDASVLARSDSGTVAVLAGAARPGSDYAGASARARSHYESIGAEVIVVPDPREGVERSVEAMGDGIALVVLPGGSPTGLRSVLTGAVEDRLVELFARGTSISGASAGAMVLCEHMVRPDRRDVVAGLGLAPGLALPHWTPGSDRGWPIPDDLGLWGLPECGGVVIDGSSVVAVGRGDPSRRLDGAWVGVARE